MQCNVMACITNVIMQKLRSSTLSLCTNLHIYTKNVKNKRETVWFNFWCGGDEGFLCVVCNNLKFGRNNAQFPLLLFMQHSCSNCIISLLLWQRTPASHAYSSATWKIVNKIEQNPIHHHFIHTRTHNIVCWIYSHEVTVNS